MADTAFDIGQLSAKHTAPETTRRTRRRHWAEFRLRAYGIFAILLAAAALIVLIYTIITKAIGVTNEYYLSLDVPITVSEQDEARINDPNPRLMPNLNKIVRAELHTAVGAEGLDRRSRRSLNALLSVDAGLELGGAVKANPDLIGGSYHYEALLDDQVQLYFKGDFGRLRDAGTNGALTLTPGESESQVVIEARSDSFSEVRELMQDDRAREARNARRNGDDQARAFRETEAAIADTTNAEELAQLEASLATFQAERDRFYGIADTALREATDMQAVFGMRTDDPSLFIRVNRGWIKVTELGRERMVGEILDPLTGLGQVADGDWTALVMPTPEDNRNLNDRQLLWLENFKREDRLVVHTNTRLLTSSDSSSAELAGIWGALVGSFWTMMVTFLLVFPLGVMASIYLEEFAPKNKLTEFIEININNLAAVPSIVFGLLGLTVLLSGVSLFGVDLFDGLLKAFAEDPRSTPLAGGVVLALMSLPTIIIAARASIKAVPPSIRDAALGLGASKLQTSTHHVLPLAMPGILTGSIIAMAQALGETAPLIIIGMNSFIQDPPGDPLDKANVLPSLIYLWNNNSERLFDGKTAVAITVLLLFLILMNALAVVLRKRFERRW
jgi:phosphate transport system permease protein